MSRYDTNILQPPAIQQTPCRHGSNGGNRPARQTATARRGPRSIRGLGWLLIASGMVLVTICGCSDADSNVSRAQKKGQTRRTMYRADRPTGSISARLDRFIPPELTDYPMPAGLGRFPDVPQDVAEAFSDTDNGTAVPTHATNPPAGNGVPPLATGRLQLPVTQQMLSQLAIVARKTFTESATADVQKPPAESHEPTNTATGQPQVTNQWGGSSLRNNVVPSTSVPIDWNPGQFDFRTGAWKSDQAQHVRWAVPLGSQTYGTPLAVGGQIYVATNNGAGYLKQYPKTVDLGCILCFRQSDGQFLWQFSAPKLESGPQNDWPDQGICCAPLIEGDRLWSVTNRGEVVCLDTRGFADDEDDGLERITAGQPDPHEADVIWRFDMMKTLHIFQHNMCSCSVTALDNVLFVNTSNGVDDSHEKIPAPDAPSFIALDKHTGKVLWTDNSPGRNILHGQWSSPAVGKLGGIPQVIFAGGDGWIYSFRADRADGGKPELLWKFDVNPKTWKWSGAGAGDRNNIIATPVIHDGLVYIASGQDPEFGEGPAYLWCIDPTRRGDVSRWLAVKTDNPTTPLPLRRMQAVIPDQGEKAIDNPNSAAVWGYYQNDANGDGEIDFEEEMHRSIGMVAIKDGLLIAADFAGLLHCLDAKTGKVHWTYDLMAPVWGTPLIAGSHVYVADEEGDVRIFKLSPKPHEPVAEINMGDAIYSTPTVENGTLYISTRSYLFAIGNQP